MRSLKDIRNANKRSDDLFSGMEEKPKKLPEDLYNAQYEFYQEVIKPKVERVHNRQIEN